MALAFGVLRWPTDAVWRATPRELAAALFRVGSPVRPATSGDLERLMQSFPDRAHQE